MNRDPMPTNYERIVRLQQKINRCQRTEESIIQVMESGLVLGDGIFGLAHLAVEEIRIASLEAKIQKEKVKFDKPKN
jgi:hypothetical protein